MRQSHEFFCHFYFVARCNTRKLDVAECFFHQLNVSAYFLVASRDNWLRILDKAFLLLSAIVCNCWFFHLKIDQRLLLIRFDNLRTSTLHHSIAKFFSLHWAGFSLFCKFEFSFPLRRFKIFSSASLVPLWCNCPDAFLVNA